MFGLDVLRATAILLVLLSHSHAPLRVLIPIPRDVLRLAGNMGVTLFFVLSGFLIGRILFDIGDDLARPRSLARFWFRRWMRTLPSYFLYLFVLLQVTGSPGFLETIRYATFTQSLLAYPTPFFDHSWSLAVEEWFYVTFPLVVHLLLRTVPRERAIVITAIAFTVIPIGARVAIVWGDADLGIQDLATAVVCRMDSIMIGVLAAWLCRLDRTRWLRTRRACLALALPVLVVPFVLGRPQEMPAVMRVLIFTSMPIGFALMLPAASSLQTIEGRWVERVIRSIALWSYSMYLWNLAVRGSIQSLVTQVMGRDRPAALCAIVVFFAGTFAISALLYRCFELPLLRLRDQRAAADVRLR